MESKCCGTLDELQSCLQTGDFSAIPTAQVNLRNFELPISKDDVDFLSGQDAFGEDHGVDFYANPSDLAPQRGSDGNLSMSVAHSLIRSGLRFRTDFVLDAIAIIAHVEPYAWLSNGNVWKGQDAYEDYPFIPTSPIFGIQPCLGMGYEDHGPEQEGPFFRSVGMSYGGAAQLEWGSPTWRAAHYFMQTYRLAMLCPDAANTFELLDERLSDLGNCHMGVSYNGFGECGASQIYGVRRVNRRLRWMVQNKQVPQIAGTKERAVFERDEDLGYYLPYNEDLQVNAPGVGCECHVHAGHEMSVPSSYGSASVSPYMCQWYRLPVPRVISHDDNLEILLKRDASDNGFYQRMLHEMAYHDGMSPIPDVVDLTSTVQYHTDKGLDGCPYTVNNVMFRIPGGQMRVGIALKGHLIDKSLCCQIKQGFNAMGAETARKLGIFRTERTAVAEGGPAQDTLPIVY